MTGYNMDERGRKFLEDFRIFLDTYDKDSRKYEGLLFFLSLEIEMREEKIQKESSSRPELDWSGVSDNVLEELLPKWKEFLADGQKIMKLVVNEEMERILNRAKTIEAILNEKEKRITEGVWKQIKP
jgi:hypothetical protein